MKVTIATLPLLALLLSGCGAVYTPQQLPKAETSGTQEELDLKIVALTSAVAQDANRTPFTRRVVIGSNLAGPAQLVDERSVISVKPPASGPAPIYRIGVGDVLQYARLMPTVSSTGTVTDEYSVRALPVTAEGYVSIVEVGRVDVAGKTIAEAEEAISAALLREGVDPRFEVSVAQFNSQKIYLGGIEAASVLPFTDRPLALDELLSSAGTKLEPGSDKVVKIFRDGTEYRLSARDTLTRAGQPRYFLYPGDRIYVENMVYRPETVILTGEVGSQSLFPISAEARQTLSDAMFSRGATALFTSDTSQVYLIRRNGEEATAYHLDASNPARLSIAGEVELRPQDIIFISEQPVTRYNRVLQQVLGALAGSRELRDNLDEEFGG